MITIKCFLFNPVDVNCYVVSDSNGEGVVIDCGAFDKSEFNDLQQYVESNKIALRHALQTHMHFDHVFGLDYLYNRYGLKPECHAEEAKIYEGNPRLAMELCGAQLPLPTVEMGNFLNDGQTITLGNLELKVMHTPGHTPGGLCFYCHSEGILFSGDTLFQGSIGRTDTPFGNWREEIESVNNKLLTLPPETVVYPGHGPSTTVEYELRYNPYVGNR